MTNKEAVEQLRDLMQDIRSLMTGEEHSDTDKRDIEALQHRITILPSCRADNIGVSTGIPKDLFPIDRADSELTYNFLKKKVEDLFLLFVRGIIKNFERSKA